MKTWDDFTDPWVVDYEFYGDKGEPQTPICYAAKNVLTGKVIKHWVEKNETLPEYPTNEKTLIIAYFASAEMGCHKALNFPFPLYILDLFTEFRCLTNGLKTPNGRGLLGACNYYNVRGTDTIYKDSMRKRILEGPPYTPLEKKEILKYCKKDVDLTTKLFKKMRPYIDLPQALLRGRYMSAVAHMEYYGVPIDTEKLTELQECWDLIKEELIWRIDQQYHVFEGTVFKIAKFKEYLETNQIPWDYTETGLPKTDNTYLSRQAKAHPEIKPLQELRYTLGQMKLNSLQVGKDGRNRCLISPFASKTGRNQPSSSKFIFGASTWFRHLIKPQKGTALSYIDYSHQELSIASALSGDKNLIAICQKPDPYIQFAIDAGAVPTDATKQTHADIREKFKRCMLASNYGMQEHTFANYAKISVAEAKYLLQLHRRKYRDYWKWNTCFIDQGILSGSVTTKFGWKFHTPQAKYRTLLNWPIQSTGSDILRLAICLCTSYNIRVIAPVHDALLIEAPLKQIDAKVTKTQKLMEDASEYILGVRIPTEAKTIKHPNNYTDKRGQLMWDTIWEIIHSIPEEVKRQRLLDTTQEYLTLEHWQPQKTKTPDHLSKKRRGQLLVQPHNVTEKHLAQRIQEKSNLSHLEVMHLIKEARDTDYDLEHEIDWDNQGYDDIKETIEKDTNPLKKKTLRELSQETY